PIEFHAQPVSRHGQWNVNGPSVAPADAIAASPDRFDRQLDGPAARALFWLPFGHMHCPQRSIRLEKPGPKPFIGGCLKPFTERIGYVREASDKGSRTGAHPGLELRGP